MNVDQWLGWIKNIFAGWIFNFFFKFHEFQSLKFTKFFVLSLNFSFVLIIFRSFLSLTVLSVVNNLKINDFSVCYRNFSLVFKNFHSLTERCSALALTRLKVIAKNRRGVFHVGLKLVF